MSRYTLDLKPMNRSIDQKPAVCDGKVRYRYVKDAKKEANRLIRSGLQDPIAIYSCEFCNRYHIGKSTRTILSRIQVIGYEPPQKPRHRLHKLHDPEQFR